MQEGISFWYSRVSPELKEAGAKYGIDYAGKGDRYPYTVPAHALLDWAEKFDKHWQLSEAYYKVNEEFYVDQIQLLFCI